MSVQIIQGNALAIPLADKSVHTVVTSPPYWGLRDYGVEGQLGLEPTFDEYLENMLKVFTEVHRVLRDDGTLWLNMGDGYCNYRPGAHDDNRPHSFGGARTDDKKRGLPSDANVSKRGNRQPGIKDKDLIGQPWALAFALRADGWYLRSDIIWHKPAPMPESVSDRPTKAHEYLFLLTKREHYFFDQAAWLEPASPESHGRISAAALAAGATKLPIHAGRKLAAAGSGTKTNGSFDAAMVVQPTKRNQRTVWTVGSQPTPEAHFATFPEALVEPCLLAGCPSKCCPVCGQGWEPIEEKSGGQHRQGRLDRQKRGR